MTAIAPTVRTALTLVAAALTLVASTDALANCDAPEVIVMDDENLNSWQFSVEGSWTKQVSPGVSDSHCWKKDVNSIYPQVLLESYGTWYIALGNSCSLADLGAYNNALNALGPSGAGDDPTLVFDYMHAQREVYVGVTADDAYVAHLDGQFVGADNYSHATGTYYTTSALAGQHTLEIEAWDIYSNVAGMAASVEIEGCSDLLVTSQANWTVDPQGGDGVFEPAHNVGSYFGLAPDGLADDGADYIWWSPDARDLGRATFRLQFSVQ